jgi:hypothetical protein
MTEDELQNSFGDFNSRYFGDRLSCKVNVTDDWIDAEGKYYPDSAVNLDPESLMSGTAGGVSVHRATALYNHSKDLISILRWMLAGEKAPRALLLHEMAHSTANEPETDHGPKWHKEMNRFGKCRPRLTSTTSRQASRATSWSLSMGSALNSGKNCSFSPDLCCCSLSVDDTRATLQSGLEIFLLAEPAIVRCDLLANLGGLCAPGMLPSTGNICLRARRLADFGRVKSDTCDQRGGRVFGQDNAAGQS